MIQKTTFELIKNSIDNKTIINFFYQNKWSKYESFRKVAPLALGKMRTSGRWALRGFLMGGGSYSISKGLSKGNFRLFLLSKIRSIDGKQEIGGSNNIFMTPTGYRRGDRDLTGIVAQLSHYESNVYCEELEDWFDPILEVELPF